MNYKSLIIFCFLLLILLEGKISLSATPLESLVSKKDLPDGWALIDGPYLYTKKTLFEHIDGQAELFFKYGFQKSVFAIYQKKKSPENQVELDIYDMGNILQAFGIFSRFRNEDRPIGIGLDSFSDDRFASFYKGKYFVMLYATESNPSFLKQLAMTISLKILDRSNPPKEINYFPKNGLKSGSIQYFPEGLLGHQFLKRGFQGTYIEKYEDKVEVEDKDKARTEDKEVQLFIAIFKDSHEAMSALKVYRDDLSKKGRVHVGISSQFGSNTLKGEDPYQGQVIVVHKGFYVVGVVGFGKEEYAKNLLAEFIRNIR